MKRSWFMKIMSAFDPLGGLQDAVEDIAEREREEKDRLKIKRLYGKTHKITKIMSTKIYLGNLGDNQSVCYGDGETYSWLLTRKNTHRKIQ